MTGYSCKNYPYKLFSMEALKNHQMITSIKKFILDLILPEFCSGCNKEGTILCESCLKELRQEFQYPKCFYCGARSPAGKRTPAGRTCKQCRKQTLIYAFFSPFPYSSKTVKNLIHKLKYNRAKKIAVILGSELNSYFSKFATKRPKKFIVVPIPLYKNKYRERGFNQSELIAGCLSKNCGAINLLVLKKIKSTPDQTELSGAERRINVKGTFLVSHEEQIKDKDILIVDDVKTTGSTIEAAAEALKKSGAKKVWALTVAN